MYNEPYFSNFNNLNVVSLYSRRTPHALVVPILIGNNRYSALIDTGAFTSALPLEIFQKIRGQAPESILEEKPKPPFRIGLASNEEVEVLFRAKISFTITPASFSETFLILPNMKNILLGYSFLYDNDVKIDVKKSILSLPDFTFQLSYLQNKDGEIERQHIKGKFLLYALRDQTIAPLLQDMIEVDSEIPLELQDSSGIIEPLAKFEKAYDLCITSSLNKFHQSTRTHIGVINLTDDPIIIPAGTFVASYTVLTPEQAKYLLPLEPKILENSLLSEKQICQLISDFANTENNTSSQNFHQKFWFPTPETCPDSSNLTNIEKQIYETLCDLRQKENIDPENNENDRNKFLQQFKWQDTLLTQSEINEINKILLEYHDIFARHRLDIGVNHNFKIKLTPEHDRPIYSQSPPTPIHIRDELQVELALLQYYGIITVLPFSKYSSPIFAQRKPSGKLRLLIDLRKINHLIRHDYDTHNFPISTLADAGAHLAGKKYFCKLDCSQAYFALQMEDSRSVQMLAFNFASRTYAFLRMAQGLSRAVSAFSSFMRQQLDECILADKCFQYVDDVGTAAHTVEEMTNNLRSLFDCIRSSGLKLTPTKCEFGKPSIEFLGSTITSGGMSPINSKISRFLDRLKPPQTVKQVRRFIGFCQFYKPFLPRLAEKLLPFYQLLKVDQEFILGEDQLSSFETLKNDLATICSNNLRLPTKDSQYVILADASFYAAGYVLMIEDYTTSSNGQSKIYAPVCFGSRIFQPAQLKLSIYAKEFLAVHFAFDHFAHIVWGVNKPVLILTDNKSLTRFFQAKKVPGSLWNAVDHVLSFRFVLGHIPGRANLAADYLSRTPLSSDQKLTLRLQDSVPTVELTVDMEAQTPETISELLSLDQIDTDAPVDELQESFDNVVSEFTTFTTTHHIQALHEANPLDTFDLLGKTDPINLVEAQNSDPSLKTVKKWLQSEAPVNSLHVDNELRAYIKHLPRLVLVNGVIYRKYFDHTGKETQKQFCVPKELRKELIYRCHNSSFSSHNGITKTVQEFRKRFYFPQYHETLSDYIRNCLTCNQAKPVKPSLLKLPLKPVASLQNFPSDMLQIDLVGPLPESNRFKFILTAIDVFSRYLFATPLPKADALSVGKALFATFMRHSYIPTLILSDLGKVFTSSLLNELTKMLQIKLKHATLKHAQTIGLLERTHAELKRILKVNENSSSSDWHKFVDTAVFVHNTTYHNAIKCTPSLLFHGRDPITPIDLRFNTTTKTLPSNNFEFITTLHSSMSELFSNAREHVLQSYLKYKSYYDRKCAATPLQLYSYCLLLDPKITNPNQSFEKQQTKWLPLYRVEQIISNNNYIVRKVGTNSTQCVHRIRLRPIKPKYQVNDIETIDPNNFQPDGSVPFQYLEPDVFDNQLEQLEAAHDAAILQERAVNQQLRFNLQPTATTVFPTPQPQGNHQNTEDVFVVEGTQYTEPSAIESEDVITVPDYLTAQTQPADRQPPHKTQYNLRRRVAVLHQRNEPERESRVQFFFIAQNPVRAVITPGTTFEIDSNFDSGSLEFDISTEPAESDHGETMSEFEERSELDTFMLDDPPLDYPFHSTPVEEPTELQMTVDETDNQERLSRANFPVDSEPEQAEISITSAAPISNPDRTADDSTNSVNISAASEYLTPAPRTMPRLRHYTDEQSSSDSELSRPMTPAHFNHLTPAAFQNNTNLRSYRSMDLRTIRPRNYNVRELEMQIFRQTEPGSIDNRIIFHQPAEENEDATN